MLSQVLRTIGIAIVQSFAISFSLEQMKTLGGTDVVIDAGWGFRLMTVLTMTAGSCFVMWLGEQITERGIGQGASLVIFLNIVATLPQALGSTIEKAQTGDRSDVFGIIVLVLVFLVTIVGIIFVQEGARRLPIVSAKRQVGGSALLPNRQSYLPLKLNAGGVMPIIFASALIFLPITIANFSQNPLLITAASALNPSASNPWPYALLFFSLILGFSYFYASLTFNPTEVATNLKRGGVAIPGVRPGSATANYLEGVKNRLTLLGGLFLGAVAIIPSAVERATNRKYEERYCGEALGTVARRRATLQALARMLPTAAIASSQVMMLAMVSMVTLRGMTFGGS